MMYHPELFLLLPLCTSVKIAPMNFPSGPRKIAIRSLFVLFGAFGALIAAETFVRMWQPASTSSANRPLVTKEEEHAAQAARHKPNTPFTWVGHAGLVKEFSISTQWNSLGFNDDDHSFENPSRHFRIVVLGDSLVEALEVSRHQSFHKLLEKKLNAMSHEQKFEVIALGRAGNGARRNYQWLEQLGMKYRPDLVMMEFFPTNDVLDDSNDLRLLRDEQILKLRKISPLMDRPAIYRPKSDSFILNHSKLFPMIAQSLVNLRFRFFRYSLPSHEQIPVQYFIYAADYPHVWKRAWKTTLEHINKTRELASSGESDFLLIYFSERFKLSKEDQELLLKTYPAMAQYKWDFDHPQKILDHFSKSNRIRFLNLEPLFAAEYQMNKIPLHYEYDGHWNLAGHNLAAEMILRYLIENQITRKGAPD
jgi:hypothetical protein